MQHKKDTAGAIPESLGPTQEQRKTRTGYIGSGHAPAVMGCSPYQSAYDVWAYITGRLEPPKMNDVMRLGLMLEPVVIDLLEQKIGEEVTREVPAFAGCPLHTGPVYCGAHLDGMIGNHTIVEAKTSGMASFLSPDWGLEGTDQVPERVIVQVHHQFLCTGLDNCLVPALIPPRGFVLYEIQRNNELIAAMLERYEYFWHINVLGDTPPEDSFPGTSTVKRWKREPGSITRIDGSLVADYERLKAEIKALNKLKDEAFCKVGAAIGDAEAADYEGGSLTYYADKRGVRRMLIKMDRED
jgi:putative phage-type endonuclease